MINVKRGRGYTWVGNISTRTLKMSIFCDCQRNAGDLKDWIARFVIWSSSCYDGNDLVVTYWR